MKKIKEFHAELGEALEERMSFLESDILPKTRELFKTYYSAFNAVFMLLLKKALIKDDPYKHEYRLSEISLPSLAQIPESEKSAQLGIRLSSYNTQIDYINSYYSFTLEFFNKTRLKLLKDFLNYIDWNSVAEVSNNPTTRALASYLSKIRQGSDQIAVSVINTSISQLSSTRKLVFSNLSLINDYYKEFYKYQVREKVLLNSNVYKYASENSLEDTLSVLKMKFTETMPGEIFSSSLISEIIEEEFSPVSSEKKEDLLDRLTVKNRTETKKIDSPAAIKPPSLNILLNAAVTISSATIHIKSLIDKIENNFSVLEEPRGSAFIKWLYRLIYTGKKRIRIFDIEYLDELAGIKKTEKINFDNLMKKYSKMIADINSAKLKAAISSIPEREKKEDYLLLFIGENILSLKTFIHHFSGIEKYIKERAKLDKISPARIKGFILEINSIKNCIIKSQQLSQEYTAAKEEYNQFKALGITEKSIDE